MRVLIADDEPLVREALRVHLAALAPDAAITEAEDGPDAVGRIVAERPDVAFLDIRMPGLDGFDVIDALASDVVPVIVFVTAHDEYALRAFQASAVDYLLKPFDRDRVRHAWERAVAMVRGLGTADAGRQIQDVLRRLREGSDAERLALRMGGRTVLVPVEEIDYLRGEGNYVQVVTSGRSILLRETMRSLEERLQRHGFLRLHRSVLVNFARVREVRSAGSEKWLAILNDGTRLPVSRAGKRLLDPHIR